ncbi:MAG: hypothetical protein LUM44_17025 [Pyrinomonadaceae bacterium]|nr:hypothetical protein [Pyrinomonadaceae bacterium]
MKRVFLILAATVFCFALLLEKSSAQNTQKEEGGFKINSAVINEEREILVDLPAEYETLPNERFPVLYMLDGEGRNPEMMKTIINHLESNFQIPPLILVSIPNTIRNRDLTPTEVKDFPNSGGGDKFLEFLETELFPQIEKNYRTQPYRIFAGHSFGGLTVVYTMLNKPKLFNAYIAASPALFWDENLVIKQTPQQLKKNKSAGKIMFVGLGEEPDLIKEYNLFRQQILALKPMGLDYEFKLFPKENHNSAIFLEYYYGLKKVYSDWSPIPKKFPLSKTWLREMELHFQQLTKKYGYQIQIPEALLNGIGYGLMYQEKRIDDAIEAFRKNAELYPDSANVFDSLGEAYEVKEDFVSASKNYKKAFELAEAKGNANLAKSAKANFDRVNGKIK